MPFEWKSKNVLITGPSSGIGKVFAEKLASRGSNLILASRSKEELELLARDLGKRYQIKTFVFPVDLSIENSPEALYKEIESAGLSVDVLINNAGFGYLGKFLDQDLQRLKEMTELNMQSLMILTHLFMKKMVEKKSGGIMNIASTAAFQPIARLNVYAATKAFVLNFTEALWGEYKDCGVRIMCLCPGNTVTEFHQIAGIDKKRTFLAATADELVDYGIEKFSNSSSPSVIHGFMNKMMAFSSRLFPRRWVIEISLMIYKRNKKN